MMRAGRGKRCGSLRGNPPVPQRVATVRAIANVERVQANGDVSRMRRCTDQGDVPVADVVRVARSLHDMGCDEISVGNAIAVGTPATARAMLRAAAAGIPMAAPVDRSHLIRDQALAALRVGLEPGGAVIDAVVSGAGVCPRARRASRDVAAKDVPPLLQNMGLPSRIDRDLLAAPGNRLATRLGCATTSGEADHAMAAHQ